MSFANDVVSGRIAVSTPSLASDRVQNQYQMYYVYILKNLESDYLYIGYSCNLRRRIEEHKSGKVYTTKRLGKNIELIYYEAYKSKEDAQDREKSFKKSGSVYNGLIKRIKRSRGD